MKGYIYPRDPGQDELPEGLPTWEAIVVGAVGTVIEFWGFKANHGRIWALLYLRSVPYSAAQIRDELGLSKGAVSMILRELETWGVISRVRMPKSKAWHFQAETEFMKMIGRVFREREVMMVKRVREDLEDAERLARQKHNVPPATLERLGRMRQLAGIVDHALNVFLKTAKLDIGPIRGIFSPEEE